MEKDAIIKKHFQDDETLQAYCLAHDFKPEMVRKYVKTLEGFEVEKDVWGYKEPIKYIYTLSKKDVQSYLLDNLDVTFFMNDTYTLEDVLKRRGRAVIPILDVISEELLLTALGSWNFYEDIPENRRSWKIKLATLIKYPYEMSKIQDVLSDEQVIEAIRENTEVFRYLNKERVNKNILYSYLERMVKTKQKVDYLSLNLVSDELKDRVYWQAICMSNPYYLKTCPTEYISGKLIKYVESKFEESLERSDYTAPLSLLEALSDELKTRDICMKACLKHFAAVKLIPKEFQNDEFYEELIERGQVDFITNVDLNTISPELLEKAILSMKENHYFHFWQNKIPASIWTEGVIKAVAQRHQHALEEIPSNKITKEICLMHMRVNGNNLDQVPAMFMDMDVIRAAMQCSGYGAYRRVPEKFKTKEFYEEMIRERWIYNKDIPVEYYSEEMVLDYIEHGKSLELSKIPSEYLTEKVIKSYIRREKQNCKRVPHIAQDLQTPEMTQWIIDEMEDLNEIKNHLYMLPHISEEILDKLLDEYGVRLLQFLRYPKKGILDKILSLDPYTIIEMPEWYREEFRKGNGTVTKVATIVESHGEMPLMPKPSTARSEVVPMYDEGMFETCSQLSLFDFLSA